MRVLAFLLLLFLSIVNGSIKMINPGDNLETEINGGVTISTFIINGGNYLINEIGLRKDVTILGFGNISCAAPTGAAFYFPNGNNSISGLTIKDCEYGIIISDGANHLISNISFESTNGVFVKDTSYVTISDCHFRNQKRGIGSEGTGEIILERNTFIDNGDVGESGGAVGALQTTIYSSNNTFIGNIADLGGAIYIAFGAKLISTLDTFENNRATHSGGAIEVRKGTIIASLSTFRNNTGNTFGGAVRIDSDGDCKFSSCTFDLNTAEMGGGAYCSNTQAKPNNNTQFQSCIFTSNSANSGGAIYMDNDNIKIMAGIYGNNMAKTGGVTIHAQTNSRLSIVGAEIYSSKNGTSAIYILNSQVDNIFEKITISGGFGGIYLQGSMLTILNSTFALNVGQYGAITATQTSKLIVKHSNFTNNRADSGGAIRIENSNDISRLENLRFESNSAENGTVYLRNSAAEVVNCNFAKNNVTNGAGVFVLASLARINGTTFFQNRAGQTGGAVWGYQSEIRFSQLYCFGNTANVGGCIFISSSFLDLRNSNISGNDAEFGAGLSLLSGSGFIQLTTIVNNIVRSGGGGLYFQNAYSTFIFDCVIQANQVVPMNQNQNIIGGGGILAQDSKIELGSCDISKNSAPLAGGLYFIATSPSYLSLIVSCTILNNEGGSKGLTMNRADIVVMRETHITQENSLYPFCCGNSINGNPSSQVCNYPVCNGTCLNSNFCNCPFATLIPINSGAPLLPSLNTTCNLRDSCLVNNGGCDHRVTCNNGICGDCPEGTHGDGKVCLLFCGNNTCDIGEDCVSCPQDCGSSTSCGLCGDSKCENTQEENCSNCREDCGPCETQNPPTCKNNCNGNGRCNNRGVCICSYPWTGPTCSARMPEPVVVVTNVTQPELIIDPSPPGTSSSPSFSLSIVEIGEKDTNGNTIRSYFVPEVNFSRNYFEEGLNKKFNYSASLPNGALMHVIIWNFEEEATQFNFANITTTFPQHTIKINIKVTNWPFMAITNSLFITMDTKAKTTQNNNENEICFSNNEDEESGNLNWLIINIGEVSLYGQFLDKAIVDGRVRSVSNRFNQTSRTITSFVPHFWYYAEVDPNFNVLLGEENKGQCEKDNSDEKKGKSRNLMAVYIAVPIAVVIIASIVLFIVLYPRIKLRMQLRKSDVIKPPSEQQMVSVTKEKKIEIEKRMDMEVNTVAGNYVVQM